MWNNIIQELFIEEDLGYEIYKQIQNKEASDQCVSSLNRKLEPLKYYQGKSWKIFGNGKADK